MKMKKGDKVSTEGEGEAKVMKSDEMGGILHYELH